MATPQKLCDTAGMDRPTWLKVRAHGPDGSIPFTIGGSDVGVIMGVSPFKTASELWYEKAGLIVPDDSANAGQKKLGHKLEPIVAEIYADKTGNRIIEDTGLYQHAKYPFMLANLDYRFERATDGVIGVFDSKTTTYRKAREWDDDRIPFHYELQIRFYMAVMDFSIGALGCLWGNNPDADFAAPPYIERDLAIEETIIEAVYEFIESLHHKKPPTLSGVPSDLALKALGRIVAEGDKTLPTVELGAKYAKKALKIAAIHQEIAEHNSIIKEKTKEAEQLSVQICEAMRKHEEGIIDNGKEEVLLHYVTKYTKRVDTKRLQDEQPTIYEEYRRSMPSRKLKVEVKPKTA